MALQYNHDYILTDLCPVQISRHTMRLSTRLERYFCLTLSNRPATSSGHDFRLVFQCFVLVDISSSCSGSGFVWVVLLFTSLYLAARLVKKASKRSSAKLLLKDLHWLPVKDRIIYKIAVLVFNIINNNSSPSYLRELITVSFPQTQRSLRSSQKKAS